MFFSSCFYQLFRELFKCFCVECIYSIHLFRRGRKITEFSLLRQVILLQMAQMAMKKVSDMHINTYLFMQRRRICLDFLRLSFPTYLHPRSQGLTTDTALPKALAKTKTRSDLIGRMNTMECGN